MKVIIDLMRSICRTTRWLVTASLMVSLGLTGLFPQVMVWGESGTVVSAFPELKCCCGTEDGRCCGMGCCVARKTPAEPQNPCPTKDDDRDGRTCPLAIAFAKALLGSDNDGRGALFGRPSTDAGRSLAESSLQAKHVRLDT